MSNAFVLDTYEKPLNPVHPGRARLLLKQGKAAVFKRYPFTIILKIEVEQPQLQPLRLKLDPGSKTTGIALVDDQSGRVVFAAELKHRGGQIKKDLEKRRGVRRGRRARHTKYRKARFDNRRRPKGWLAPSLMSRVHNIETWVNRLRRLCPITTISMELVRFDMQAQENPDIQGKEYQQGTLAGYELREYLLEKWNRTCSYCGKKDIPLQLEHIQARANGGTNRVSNLCLACEKCNLEKTHWLDAACVGASTPPVLTVSQIKPLHITAIGHGNRQMCLMNESGFPRTKPKARHFSHAFRTGDSVKAIIPARLNNPGVHTGRLSAKAKGGFTIYTHTGKITDVGKQYCRRLQKADGYGYAQISASADAFLSSPRLKA